MLPVEHIRRPEADYQGPGYATWCMWHRVLVWEFMGSKWKEIVVRGIALRMHESDISEECILWTRTDDKSGFHFVYLAFPIPLVDGRFLQRMAQDHSPTGTSENQPIPPEAVPVIKRLADGTMLRLWIPGSKPVPPKQRINVDGVKLTFWNCQVALD